MPMTLETKERIVVDTFVTFDGFTCNVDVLIDVLTDIDFDIDIEVTDKELGKKLIELGVLKNLGSTRSFTGAKKGENFDSFYKELSDLLYPEK